MTIYSDHKTSHDLNAEARETIEKLGGIAWRVNSGVMRAMYGNRSRFVRFGQTGMEDVQGCLNGVFVAIETKRKGDQLKLEQLERLQVVAEKGGIAYVLREDNAYALQEMLAMVRAGNFMVANRQSRAFINGEELLFKEREMKKAGRKQR